jgi:hypothetical protein
VRIRNAAAPDDGGLIRPLVKRWQSGGCHYSVFGLPAVQSVLEFKWERCVGGRGASRQLPGGGGLIQA